VLGPFAEAAKTTWRARVRTDACGLSRHPSSALHDIARPRRENAREPGVITPIVRGCRRDEFASTCGTPIVPLCMRPAVTVDIGPV